MRKKVLGSNVRRVSRLARHGAIRSATAVRSAESSPVPVRHRVDASVDDGTWMAIRATTASPVAESGNAEERAAKDRLLEALITRLGNIGSLLVLERSNGSAEALADRMLAAIPGGNSYDEDAGPFYDTAGLTRWLGMSRQTLGNQVRSGDVLCVTTSDNHLLYPSFQFDEGGNPLPRLREMLAGLDPDRQDVWGDAIWLNAPAPELDGRTPAAALRTRHADAAIRLGRQAGAFFRG